MTNLTDKWKKGELPEGWYYVKGSRAEGIYAYTAEYLNNMYRPRNGERIIGQVPSYDEWQAKLEENTRLKELLKECNLAIFDYPPYDLASDKIRLQIKINKVLGEE
jgi:hypothetical protein